MVSAGAIFVFIPLFFWTANAIVGWDGYATSLTASRAHANGGSTYSTIGLATTVTTTATTDKVLILVNLNFASATTPSYMQFKVYRDNADLTSSTQDMAAARVSETTEMMNVGFSYFESPSAVGNFEYSLWALGTSTLSKNNMPRQIAGIVIPSTYSVSSTSSFTALTITTATYTTLGIDATVTTTSATDSVLLVATVDFNTDAVGNHKYTIYRNSAVAATGLVLQVVGSQSVNKNRVVSFIYVDTPGSAGSFTYGIYTAKMTTGDGSYTITESNRDMRMLTGIVFPQGQIQSAKTSTDQTIAAASWTDVGLSVTVTPFDSSDKVLIAVNINFNPVAATSSGAYTIFRGSTNLGDASYGLQTLKNPTAGEKSSATMFWLDEPNSGGVAVTYTVKCIAIAGSFTVSSDGQTRQIVAIIQPQQPPTIAPTRKPTAKPSIAPSYAPTATPTFKPTAKPSFAPSCAPTIVPTIKPTAAPSRIPTANPSAIPTIVPTAVPTIKPTAKPTVSPTANPTASPSIVPTASPSAAPTAKPTAAPTATPSTSPTLVPTAQPTTAPTTTPDTCTSGCNYPATIAISSTPQLITRLTLPRLFTVSFSVTVPALMVSNAADVFLLELVDLSGANLLALGLSAGSTTKLVYKGVTLTTSGVGFASEFSTALTRFTVEAAETVVRLQSDAVPGQVMEFPIAANMDATGVIYALYSTGSESPDMTGSIRQIEFTANTPMPTTAPTYAPTMLPSAAPTKVPTANPTQVPTLVPTAAPTATPTRTPTATPTLVPTAQPSAAPTVVPTFVPSASPTTLPTVVPTASPTQVPTLVPTAAPTVTPTRTPTAAPTMVPTAQPSAVPTVAPTSVPSASPTTVPTVVPTVAPTSAPTRIPTCAPTALPTLAPTATPSTPPSQLPTVTPSENPTTAPTCAPTAVPSAGPTTAPTSIPTASPSSPPSVKPTAVPTIVPTVAPTVVPTAAPSAGPTALPTIVPSLNPTAAPTAIPSKGPTVAPSAEPSVVPSVAPTAVPSTNPSATPSAKPTVQPTVAPTAAPTVQPTAAPSSGPSMTPTASPSVVPSSSPTAAPTAVPTGAPSAVPTAKPSVVPTATPTAMPTSVPTAEPSAAPSVRPTTAPSTVPSGAPTASPTTVPSAVPTAAPTIIPSASLSEIPTLVPTTVPTDAPTNSPFSSPTAVPTFEPTAAPSMLPTADPSALPTFAPTYEPSQEPSATPSAEPTILPTASPSALPTELPSAAPTTTPSSEPSVDPTAAPSAMPTADPTVVPTADPTAAPSASPSVDPSASPTAAPSATPSASPTAVPTAGPSVDPSSAPTAVPSADPTASPSEVPTEVPTAHPTTAPTVAPTPGPTAAPTSDPSAVPSAVPSSAPTVVPTVAPSADPTASPTEAPTAAPSVVPSAAPSESPSAVPTAMPSAPPSAAPSTAPSASPSASPSAAPSAVPSASPSMRPSAEPTVKPTQAPTAEPTATPTNAPSVKPSTAPSQNPTTPPTTGPSAAPTVLPTASPSAVPSATPTANPTAAPTTQKTVTIMQSANTVTAGTAAVNALMVTLSAVPSASLTVSFAVAGSVGSDLTFSPSSVTFTSAAAVRTTQLTVIGVNAGKYTIQATVSGSSASEFSTGIITVGDFTVVSAEATPAVPQLKSAAFSSDGSSVLVSFDSATNRGGYTNSFPCTKLLSFPGASAATCSWTDDSTIAIYPSATISADLVLQVDVSQVSLAAGGTIKARCFQLATICAQWLTASSGSAVITAPASPNKPGVTLSMPSTLGGCGSLAVDISTSTGSGGRAWKTPVVFEATSTSADASAVADYLNTEFTFSKPTKVPSAKFPGDGEYTISVTLCNFLGACGQASRTVKVTKGDGLVPTVTIPGQQQRAVSRSAELLIVPTAYTQDCQGTVSTSKLSYAWSVSSNGATIPALRSESLDPSKFRLSAFSLTALTNYEIKVTVTSQVSGLSTSTAVQVYVQQGSVVAQVAGGSTQSVSIGSSLVLDASGTYDTDVSGKTGAAAGLSFSWACVQTSPVYSTTCPLTMTNANTQALTLTAGNEAIGTKSSLTVTVFDATRSTTVSVVVQAQDSSAPIVSITSTGKSVTKVNTADRFTLAAAVTVQSSCTAVWSVDEPSVQLTTALTPSSVMIPTGSTRSLNLLLPANALPMRASLQFSLSCGASQSSIVVTTNGPPLPGAFSVSPAAGVELTQQFTFSASSWNDPDLPLSYQFGFISGTTGAAMLVQSRSEASFASSTLAAGPASLQNAVTCTVLVFDNLNANTKTTAAVTVTPIVDQAQLQTAVLTQLTASAGNNEAVKNAVAVGGAVINAVSCAAAPDCASFHRNACAKVQNTCGSCLDGYVGDIGDKNAMCVAVAASSPPTSGAGSEGSSCSTNTDCTGWLQCDTTLGSPVCYLPDKQCPDSCSGHGSCSKVNTNNMKPVAQCKAGDPSCVAVCACEDGYSGVNCATSAADLLQKQVVRTQFLQSLSDVASTDDVTADSVAAMSATLSALTQNSYELTQEAVETTNRIAATILSNAAALGTFSYEDAADVLQAMDSAAAASVRLNSTNTASSTASIMQSLALFNSLMSSQLVAGQKNVEYVQSNFRINSIRQLRGFNSSLRILSPSTLLEQSTGAAQSSVTIDDDFATRSRLLFVDGESEQEEFAVSMVTTSASSYGTVGLTYNANPVQVTVSRTSATPTRVTFVLVHNEAQSFTTTEEAKAMSFNTTCVDATDRRVEHYECPQSGTVLTHRCIGFPGVMTSYCPVLAPTCAILDPSTGEADTKATACEVVSYDAHSTVCSCTIEPTSTSRRLDGALAQSGVMDAVSVSVYIGSEFKDTFNSADDLTSAAALKRVLIVILMFSTLWAGGLLLIFGCTWRRAVLQKAHALAENNLAKKVQSIQNSRSPAVVHQYLTDYVIETFPSVFSNKPFFSRLYGEVKRHHRYLTVLTAPEGEAGDKQRILTGIELLTVQTMLMFLLAVLYDLQGPSDDGTCEAHSTEESCLSRKSVFDTTQTYCQWVDVGNASGEFTCIYQDPRFSIKIVLYIAVMVSILVSLISYPIDRIFELLSAPVADDDKAAAQDTALKRVGRRVSNMARRASNFAVNAAAAAKAKLTRATTIVGTNTRKLPAATEEAHALAAASMTVIAENSRRAIQQRQISQLRTYYESGGKYGKAEHSDSSDSDNEDAESSDSDSQTSRHDHRAASIATTSAAAAVATAAYTVSAERQQLERLSEAVHCQRRLLKPSEVEEFDAQWGLDPTGEFTQGEKSVLPCFKGKAGAEDLILAELKFVKDETAKKAEKLSIASDAHTGLEILHLFIKDLLGRDTPAAIIFETKSEEDFKHTKVVTRLYKRLAMALLVGINFFFVYYAMLTGYRKGISWQRFYLYACIVQFAVEILLFETMECVWINCAIPVLVSDEVRRVGEHITDVVRSLCAYSHTDERLFLNAPDHLFVSTNLAKKYPQLMESILVQAYTTHLPGELARKWQVGAIARSHRHQRMRNATLLGSVLLMLQYMGTAPFVVHRMFIRFVQPFVFSGLVLLFKLVVSDPIYVAVACVLIAAAVAYAGYRYYMDLLAARAKSIAPINAAYDAGADAETVRKRKMSMDSDNTLHLPTMGALHAVSSSHGDRSSHHESSDAEEKTNDGGALSSIVSATVDRAAQARLAAQMDSAPRRTRLASEATVRSSVTSMSEISSMDLAAALHSAARPRGGVRGKVAFYQSSSSGSSAKSSQQTRHSSQNGVAADELPAEDEQDSEPSLEFNVSIEGSEEDGEHEGERNVSPAGSTSTSSAESEDSEGSSNSGDDHHSNGTQAVQQV